MAKKYYDVIIIGGGVSGAAIAWKLAKYDLKVLLLEKEADLATGTTKANTAIIHGGYNADPSTVKGRLNVKGNQQIKEIVRDLNVPFKEIGSLVVALEGDDISQLTKLLENGNKNGVKSLEIVDQAWLQKNEPNLTDEARAALYSPTAGVINPWEFALAMAENAVQNGLDIQLETKVTDIIMKDKQVTGVETNKGSFYGNYIVNAAGLFADEIARMVGIDKVKIQPRKGEYYLYDQAYDFAVNHIIFQLPKSHSKGIVVTKSVDNNLMIGPTSEPVAGKMT